MNQPPKDEDEEVESKMKGVPNETISVKKKCHRFDLNKLLEDGGEEDSDEEVEEWSLKYWLKFYFPNIYRYMI